MLQCMNKNFVSHSMIFFIYQEVCGSILKRSRTHHFGWHYQHCPENYFFTSNNGILWWWYSPAFSSCSLYLFSLHLDCYKLIIVFLAVINVPGYESVSSKFHAKWLLPLRFKLRGCSSLHNHPGNFPALSILTAAK